MMMIVASTVDTSHTLVEMDATSKAHKTTSLFKIENYNNKIGTKRLGVVDGTTTRKLREFQTIVVVHNYGL